MPVGPEDLGLRGILRASSVKSGLSLSKEQEVLVGPMFAAW